MPMPYQFMKKASQKKMEGASKEKMPMKGAEMMKLAISRKMSKRKNK